MISTDSASHDSYSSAVYVAIAELIGNT